MDVLRRLVGALVGSLPVRAKHDASLVGNATFGDSVASRCSAIPRFEFLAEGDLVFVSTETDGAGWEFLPQELG